MTFFLFSQSKQLQALKQKKATREEENIYQVGKMSYCSNSKQEAKVANKAQWCWL